MTKLQAMKTPNQREKTTRVGLNQTNPTRFYLKMLVNTVGSPTTLN